MMYKSINDAAKYSDILSEGNVKIHYVRDTRRVDESDFTIELVNGYTMFPSSLFKKYDSKRLAKLIDFTHTCMGSIKGSDDMEDIFMVMQGDVWSPQGEARSLVAEKDTAHTSMSVGDIIELEDGRMFLVDSFGFTEM